MRINKKTTVLVLISFFVLTIVNAQNVDEIIAKHIEAHGGQAKWDAINSMEIKATFTAFSEEDEFLAIRTKNGCYYSDLRIGQHRVKEAFNGKWGWTIDPWHEFTFPRRLNKVEDNVFVQKAEFFSPFYNYKEKGIKVEYVGEENVDGVDTYAIKLTRPNGNHETWYLDQKTYLEFKSTSGWVDFAMGVPAESFFDDFREVNGVIIPFFIERMFGQRDRMLVIESVEFNKPVDKSIFEMPKSAEMQKLAFLSDNWDIKIEKSNRSGNLFTADNSVSKGNFESANLLKHSISVDDYYVQSMLMSYSFHANRNLYRMTAYNEFTSSIDYYEGNFKDGAFIFDNKNDVAPEANGPYLQLKIYDIMDEGFTMEINNSRDKGETWNLSYKLSFSKK